MNYSDRLHKVIPGGAHTYSRGDDQFPANAPPILSRAKGAYVWGPNNDKYLDYGMALRAVTLGYGHEEVNRAAIQQIENGNNLTRASLIELEAAELMTGLIPGLEMVKFAKNGSSVTTAAVKLARAVTGRPIIARCLQHPFFSFDDWFIGDTAIKRGVPPEISALTVNFSFNDLPSLEKVFAAHPGKIAGVILEPATHEEPNPGFLQGVEALCKKNDSIFILDEMITGFRWNLKGAATHYGVTPDLSTFGKAMANGFSLAALVGKREVMEAGGIRQEGSERIFLLSSTHGAEMCALGAFVAAVGVYKSQDVIKHFWTYGERLKTEGNKIAQEAGVGECFRFEGPACSPIYMTKDRSGQVSLPLRTLFSQEMIKNGVMMPWIALSLAHGDRELDQTCEALRKALGVYRRALDEGVEKYLVGPAIKPVFRKLN